VKLARSLDTPPNKSLDASGFSGLVIDNLSVTWLSPAASTQPFGRKKLDFTNPTTNALARLFRCATSANTSVTRTVLAWDN